MDSVRSKLSALIAKVDTHIEAVHEYRELREREEKNYRKALCDKIDRILTEISNINKRCYERMPECALMQKHVKNGEKLSSIWRDRSFRVLLALVSPIYIIIVGYIAACIFAK